MNTLNSPEARQEFSPVLPEATTPPAIEISPQRNQGPLRRFGSLACATMVSCAILAGYADEAKAGPQEVLAGTTPAAMLEAASSPSSMESSDARFAFGRVWGSDGCLEDFVAYNNRIISSQETDLCRTIDYNSIVSGIRSYFLYKRGSPVSYYSEIITEPANGYVYWEYPDKHLYAQSTSTKELSIYTTLPNGSPGFENYTKWLKGPHPSTFLSDITEEIDNEGIARDATEINRPTYNTTAPGVVNRSAAIMRQQQQAAQQQANLRAQQAAALKAAQGEAAVNRERLFQVTEDQKYNDIVPQDCDLPQFERCDEGFSS